MLVMVVSFAGCETTDGVTKGKFGLIRESDGPCGPMLEGHSPYVFEQVIYWTPDGAHLLFDYVGTILVVNREGTQLRTLVDADPRYPIEKRTPRFNFPYDFYFDVSPDGMRVVYTSCEFRPEGPNIDPERENYFDYELAIINLDGTGKQRLTRKDSFDHYPAWSPDGKSIAYFSSASGPFGWGRSIR